MLERSAQPKEQLRRETLSQATLFISLPEEIQS
jgi:hypothetical protein